VPTDVDTLSIASVPSDDFERTYKGMSKQLVQIDGRDKKKDRIRRMTQDVKQVGITNPQELERLRKLSCLERTLKVVIFYRFYLMIIFLYNIIPLSIDRMYYGMELACGQVKSCHGICCLDLIYSENNIGRSFWYKWSLY
jgi:hypothetical protein